MTDLKIIPISNISMIKNYRDVEPPSEKDTDILELSKSIEKHGVMQPVLLRLDPKKKDHYQIIFGHRRFLASKVAKKDTIPANVKEVADDDILELQVTENLQRKDVHPMDEAVAFQSLMNDKNYSSIEIAAKFAKKPEYIAQRLSLNSLISDCQKDFKTGKMLIGQAILISALSAEDQKEIRSKIFSSDGYGSQKSVSEYVRQYIFRDLSSIPWKKDDATLLPKAGACKDCPKRTGCQGLIFEGDSKSDRCLDKRCFDQKTELSFAREIKNIIETEPEIRFIYSSNTNSPSKEVLKLLSENKISPLKEYDGFQTYKTSQHQVRAKGFYISGYHKGKRVDIFLKGKATEKNASGKEKTLSASQLINEINARVKRSEELDHEKIMANIREQMLSKFSDNKHKNIIPLKIIPRIEAIVWMMLYDSMGYHADDVMKHLLLDRSRNKDWNQKPGSMIERFMKLGLIEKTNILFNAFNHKYGITATAGIGKESFMLRELAAFIGVDIVAVEAKQKIDADKRRINADKRIALLKKPAAPKKIIKKSAPKKAAKK